MSPPKIFSGSDSKKDELSKMSPPKIFSGSDSKKDELSKMSPPKICGKLLHKI